MKKLIVVLVIGFTSFLFAKVGEVTEVGGIAHIERVGKKINIEHILVSVEKGDKITTGKDGRVKVTLNDNTKISIGKNSSLLIDDYLDDPKDPKAEFSLVKGSFRVITGKIGKIKPENFIFKTKNATIGIRGTIFAGNESAIICTRGKVIITTPDGTIILKEGKIVKIAKGEAPTYRNYTRKEMYDFIKASGWYKYGTRVGCY